MTFQLKNWKSHGFVERKIYPVVPPKVENRLTKLGLHYVSRSAKFRFTFLIHIQLHYRPILQF